MKKILLALFTLCTLLANAQKLDKGLLWKISGNGLSKPSYLFGTIHITCDATLDKNILKALDETGQLYLELDMDDPAMMSEMMNGIAMKDGKKMSTLASPEDFQIVNAFVKENLGISLSMVESYKPFMISAMMFTKMIDCPAQSFEAELMKVAKAQSEEVYGLETIQEQMTVFDDIPYEDQMKDLVKSAKSGLDKEKAEFKKLMDSYNNKDLNVLMALMNDTESPMYSDHNDVLLADRNKNWIPKIEKITKEKSTFFGVGAAHLAGDNGVINLLRKKGYKVEAVK